MNSIVAFRILESIKMYQLSSKKKLYPKIKDLKFHYCKNIQFILDFGQIQVNPESWVEEMGEKYSIMLEEISIKFGVSFHFISIDEPQSIQEITH